MLTKEKKIVAIKSRGCSTNTFVASSLTLIKSRDDIITVTFTDHLGGVSKTNSTFKKSTWTVPQDVYVFY